MKDQTHLTRRGVLKGISALGLTAVAASKRSLAHTLSGPSNTLPADDLLSWVNVMLGTGGHGHTYPGATVPFGMVQLSPDTYNNDWDWCSGYHASDNTIMGFSHTHLSGTGCGDLLDFLLVPRTGEVRLVPGDRKQPGTGYRSRFSHETERAHPGYYAVHLEDTGIEAELTATEHVGFHRYTFPESDTSHFVLDLTHAYGDAPRNIAWCGIESPTNGTIFAGHATNAWCSGRQMYIALEFSRPWESIDFYLDDNLVTPDALRKATSVEGGDNLLRGKNIKAVVHFKTRAGEKILVRAGLSGVSTKGAVKNLTAEVSHWDFERTRHAAEEQWRMQLGKIRVETANDDRKRVFYSSLYHTMLGPTLFDDADGQYRGMDGQIHQLSLVNGRRERNYTTFSLWDTFRAEHPLITFIHADRVPDMVNSLIRMAQQSPAGMPVWPLQGHETGTMTGYHSAAVIAEACTKGFTGIDYKAAYDVMHKRAFEDNYRGLGWYRDIGFIPCDLEDESVSKTLEYGYDDWAIAHVADYIGEHAAAEELRKRSRNYAHYWDESTRFLRPKFKSGEWATPFDPIEMGHTNKYRDYTESNAWQATFGVQHDVTHYMTQFGGDAAFFARLEELFNQSSALPADAPPDIAGLIGQYAHGNEPSHHIAYLYSYAGRPDKTQERVHYICNKMYSNTLDGIEGNEDVGQMSAWFILSSIGFYAVDPVSTHYLFGTPMFDRVTITLAEDRKLVIDAKRPTAESIYIEGVTLDGRTHEKSWFAHADIAQGGRFVLALSDKPSESFGKSLESRPVSKLA